MAKDPLSPRKALASSADEARAAAEPKASGDAQDKYAEAAIEARTRKRVERKQR
jgi:hypothetical protein